VCQAAAGVYRESITLNNAITLDGSAGAEVRGSDDWSTGGISGNTWSGTGPWTSSLSVTNFTRNDFPDTEYYDTTLGKNLEQVFIDGVAQLRVLATPTAGQFNLGGTGGRRVILGSNPSGHLVEVTMRNTWGEANAAGLVVRNVVFKHVASSPNTTRGFGVYSVSNMAQTYQGCTFADAHGTGLEISGATVSGCTFNNCGNIGLGINGSNNTVNSNTFDNCGNGGYRSFTGLAQAGTIKAAAVHNTSYANNTITNSGGPAIWHDISCDGITIGPGNRISNTGNSGDPGAPAISWEISGSTSAPSRIHDNIIVNPAHLGGVDWRSAAIAVSTGAAVEIDHNLIQLEHGNANGISIGSVARGDAPGYYAHDVSVHDNQVMVEGGDATGTFWSSARGWGLAWNWDGTTPSPFSGANNSAANNIFWWNSSSPAADSSANRFQWNGTSYAAIASFAATAGGAGSRYMTNTERSDALAQLTVAPTGPIGPVGSALVAPSNTGATFTWTTSVPASSRVEYGTTPIMGSTTPETDITTRVTNHSVAIGGLTPATAYYFRVRSFDASGNLGSSAQYVFATLGEIRLPVVNSDTNIWGNLLLPWLLQHIAPNGTRQSA
jgi:hypothetical protein